MAAAAVSQNPVTVEGRGAEDVGGWLCQGRKSMFRVKKGEICSKDELISV